jgi:exodeoxyribonuclease V beta subunit
VLERADDERLGEDLRKLYVALTRAASPPGSAWRRCRTVERTALGYLLQGGRRSRALRRPAGAPGQRPAVCHRAGPEPCQRYEPPAATVRCARAPLPPAPRERWWIASYSRLRSAGRSRAALVERSAAQPGAGTAVEATTPKPLRTWHGDGARRKPRRRRPARFPRGAARQLPARPAGVGRPQGFAAAAAAPRELAAASRAAASARWGHGRSRLRNGWSVAAGTAGSVGARRRPGQPRAAARAPGRDGVLVRGKPRGRACADRLVRKHTLGGAPRPPLLPSS